MLQGNNHPKDQEINENARNLFNVMDTDGDGCISKQEFYDYILNKKTKFNRKISHLSATSLLELQSPTGPKIKNPG